MVNHINKVVAGSFEPVKHINLCDVCKKNEMLGVYASTCGPISFGYCKDCGTKGAEPYGALVAYLSFAVEKGEDCAPENKKINPSYQRIIDASLEVAGKTRQEFYVDVDNCIREMMEEEHRAHQEFEEQYIQDTGHPPIGPISDKE